ncbi:antibiotic biosynthesis monooxygenase [Paracrocinitomix mangrovi]|uniref:antibiotic biosynthesis monooxygenase family protein n=1 Tax=Paracrocinitomix mangrovi TaxID=2862509 RepID=UPI001C8D734C|nr:antibiotic biosynthesis monooxygenase [Paracrocinitomix mangrovi]UKN02956.1 antibiotic biosynthesis monooxygenase [Paracrocinitomix mangrovi]
MFAKTPTPPYYAVIFTSVLKDGAEDYHVNAIEMFQLASKQEGFLGAESARSEIGITVSYWKDLASIESWKNNLQHKAIKERGKKDWYVKHIARIALVEKEY